MKTLAIFLILIFLCGGVFAVSGVVPRSYEINFQPNLNKTFNFKFVLGKTTANLRVSGDLAKYVSLDKKQISGTEDVVVKLSLPSNILKPGINQINIIAGNVVGAIKIKVPYPDKFVGLELNVPNVNVGQNLKINLHMLNLGKQIAVANSSIKIYKNKKLIKFFRGASGKINASDSLNFNILLNTSNYSAGNYNAVASVNYGGKSGQASQSFRLGKLSVRVLNYTNEFDGNSVGKFKINVESLYNDNIKRLYAEVRVVGEKSAGFDTSPVNLEAWQNKTLLGFFNTKGLPAKNISANITLYYDGQSSSKIVQLKILKSFDYIFYGVLLLSLIVSIILGWMIFVFIKNMRKK